MKRPDILDTAKGYVTSDRQSTHGRPEDTFTVIANLWSAYLKGLGCSHDLDSHDAAVMLALLKVGRISQNPGHADNWVDLAGYAACGGELATESRAPDGPA